MSISHEHAMQMFLEHLMKEYSIYEKMLDLCEKERQLIEADQIEELRASLASKHALLDEVVKIEETITALKTEWNHCKNTIDAALKTRIMDVLESFKLLMEKLVVGQKENEELLMAVNKKKTAEIAQVRQAKNMTRAYSAYGPSVPQTRFMNKLK